MSTSMAPLQKSQSGKKPDEDDQEPSEEKITDIAAIQPTLSAAIEEEKHVPGVKLGDKAQKDS